MTPKALSDLVNIALDELKGRDIVTLPVATLTDIADYMVIASGTSNRHVKSLVDHVIESVKESGLTIRGVEGRETHDWVLVDAGDVLVHVMRDEARSFYDLERLWTQIPTDSETGM